jgi:lysophospholipid acyltransferase (LPLAT)-like uncharacterized protein
MFGGWWSARENKPVAMVSSSKDGDYLGEVLTHWGYSLVRGSSTRGGMEALGTAMARVRSRESNHLVITPDGPRGPRHTFKRGAFHAAYELGLPLIMLHIHYGSCRTLKSWDKFEVPLPFSTLNVFAEEIDLTGFPDTPAMQYQWIEAHTTNIRESEHKSLNPSL